MATSKALRFGQHLKELRIHLCQKSPSSQGVRGALQIFYCRDFIEEHYVNIKKNNPKFPILIRECSGVHPKIYARYDFGNETNVGVSNLKSAQILETVETLANK